MNDCKPRVRLVTCDGGYESKDHVYSDGTPMSARDAMSYTASWLSGGEGVDYIMLDQPIRDIKPVEWRRYI